MEDGSGAPGGQWEWRGEELTVRKELREGSDRRGGVEERERR